MALTDTFVKNTKHTGNATGDKHADGGGMYLHIKAAGKYWRMDYTHADKRKTLALGIYPAVSLAKARQRRDKARELLADGIDPSKAKREEKQGTAAAAANTFQAVALDWLDKTATERSATNASVPIFMAHGQQDPMITMDRAQASRQALTALGYTIEWHDYPMPHSVCAQEIDDIGTFLRRVLSI